MAISNEYLGYLEDLFSIIPGVNIRKMFGGVGMFRHGLMFALSTDDGRIAMKADEQTIPAFEAEGCGQWIYESKTRKAVSMGYWYLPEHLLDDQEEFSVWAEKAFSAAVRIDQAKPPSQRKLQR